MKNLINIIILIVFFIGWLFGFYQYQQNYRLEQKYNDLEQKIDILKNSLSANLTDLGHHNRYIMQTFLGLKSIFKEKISEIINKEGITRTTSCEVVKKVLKNIKNSVDNFNPDPEQNLFFDQLEELKKVEVEDPFKMLDLDYIKSCFTGVAPENTGELIEIKS